jgi:hypothetical protein
MANERLYPLTPEIEKQIMEAYWRMGAHARYRPAVGDGFGGIAVPLEDLNIQREARDYARRWWAEENETTFHIGLADFQARRAMIYAVEIARLCCGGIDAIPHARKLARVLVEELEQLKTETTPA